jgi:hypothetical protein
LHDNSKNKTLVYASLGGNLLDCGVNRGYLLLKVVCNGELRTGFCHQRPVAVETEEWLVADTTVHLIQINYIQVIKWNPVDDKLAHDVIMGKHQAKHTTYPLMASHHL